MRITGWCERCKKIRTVRVNAFRHRLKVQRGICSTCEVERDRERNQRYERQNKEKK